jgi:hypothetical protein
MQALTLINRVQETYAELHTYSDSGSAITLDEKSPTTIWFKTWFKRPNLFRFEWNDERRSWFVCHDGATAIISSNGKASLCTDWRAALASAVGISNGAIAIALGTLLKDYGGKKLLDLTDLKSEEKTELYYLSGFSPSGSTVELSIKKNFLFERVRQSIVLTVESQRQLLAQAAEDLAAQGRKLEATLAVDAVDRTLLTEYNFDNVVGNGDIVDSIFKF